MAGRSAPAQVVGQQTTVLQELDGFQSVKGRPCEHGVDQSLGKMARRRNLWVDSELFWLFALLKGSIELSAGRIEGPLRGLGDAWPDQWASLVLDKVR